MIPELLLGLVGFTGGVVVEKGDTFTVNMDFDMITEAEREQINKIAPLGWFYRELSKYAGRYGARWGAQSTYIYKSAFCLAIADIIEIYKADVADLEKKLNIEGPFPLSHLIYQLQKYTLALPAAYNCCKIVESKKIRGCQFLDFLANYRTGVPTVSDVITRLLRRVRIVFLKQCLSWVLHGDLEDPEKEFFIQMRVGRIDPGESVPFRGTMGYSAANAQPFDWTATYTLRLEMLPESHVSPRLAAKILFCGKAVLMLRETAAELHRLDTLEGGYGGPVGRSGGGLMAMGSSVTNPVGAIYGYISSGGGAISSPEVEDMVNEVPLPAITTKETSLAEEGRLFIENVITKNAQKSGYTIDELDAFSKQFHNIVAAPSTSFVGSFEMLIESVNMTISSRLWLLLKERFGFIQFLVGLRNSYLLGKGELFQAFLDGILQLMSNAPPSDNQADNILTWDVVRAAAKLLNLDEDVMAEVLRLRVNSPSVSVVDFSVADLIRLHGVFALGPASESTRHRHVYLGKPQGRPLDLDAASAGEIPPVVGATVSISSRTDETLDHASNIAAASIIRFTTGAATLSDAKYVLKGFSSTCLFSCEWNEVTKHLSPSNRIFPRASATGDHAVIHPAITLGTMLCTLHDTPLVHPPPNTSGGSTGAATMTVASPYGLAAVGGALRSVGIGVSIHARVVSVGTDKIDYFAKVFIWSSTPPSSGASTAGTIDMAFSANSVITSPGQSALDAGRRFSAGGNEGYIISSSGEVALAFGASSIGLPEDHNAGVLQAAATLALEVEYYRDLTRLSDADIMSVGRNSIATPATAGPSQRGLGGGIVNGIRARLRARNSTYSLAPASSWDIDTTLDLDRHMRLLGGQSYVSVVGTGLLMPPSLMENEFRLSGGVCLFNFNLSTFSFVGKGSSLSTYPVASSVTAARFPPTFSWLDSRMSQFRAWMSLKLKFQFPRVFGIVVDQDAVSAYSRIFSSLIKVRLVVHAFERLLLSRPALDTDRMFCHLRHAMHFFNSNLLYHLQVDVIDTEFSMLMVEVTRAPDFQAVLRAHKNFISSIAKMSHIDNNVVQDAIERVLQICLRFLAVSALHQHNDDVLQKSAATTGPVGEVFYLPQEEFAAIRKDFFVQVSYLLQLMKKIESRGFVFRVDFNGFFSKVSNAGETISR